MALLPSNENLSASSGLVNMPFLEGIYHSMMDEMMGDMGRIVIFHLPPIVQQDNVTQGKPAPQQYNPFFARVPVPNTNTRNPGVKITHRDVPYHAQIVFGPLKGPLEDIKGMGELAADEAQLTVVIEALPHVQEAYGVSVEGRRFRIEQTKPIGLSTRRYLMIKLKEVQELEPPTPDITIG